jgi:CubicO group peptidase (beta-lactamase class C family)
MSAKRALPRPTGSEGSTLDEIADLVVREGAAPAAAVALARRRQGAFHVVVGASPTRVAPEAIFDLASVTKPFVAVTAARLVRRGLFELNAPLGQLLPEASGTPSGSVPFLAFLAHRAGLEAHRPMFAPLVEGRPVDRRAFLAEAAAARRDDCRGDFPTGGFPPLYSDLGYLLVGAALEHVSGTALDALVDREVSGLLGLDVRSARLWLAQGLDFSERVLPTETVPFRGGTVRGVTHDENAWAFAGHGLAGHAGLFGTAESVARFGAAVLDALAGRSPAFLSPAELAPLVAEREGGSLRAGFDGKSGPSSAAGTRSSPKTFGHLGFTGTSLWCDPVAECVTVLLSNRVCPSRDNLGIRALRPEVHDLLHGASPAAGAR